VKKKLFKTLLVLFVVIVSGLVVAKDVISASAQSKGSAERRN
jgi:hypothetical protein